MNKELDLEMIVNTHLRQERQERHQRNGWYASDLGMCLRGVYLQRLEGPPEYDDRRLRLFSVGNIFQEWLTEKVRKVGHEVLVEERVEAPEYHFSGRADLLIIGNEKTLLYEIKTMHSQGFWHQQRTGGLPLPHHELQVSAYMWRLRERFPGLEAYICYVSKDDLSVLTVPVRHSEQNIEEVKRQLNTLNHAWERQAPPEAAEDIGFDANKGKWVLNWQAKYCPVHQRCTGDPDWMAKAEKRVRQLNKTT